MLATEDTIIICFAFNRPGHLHKTLHALSLNKESKSLPLRIYIDGARSESDAPLIAEVAAVAKQYENHFLSFDLRRKHENKGLYWSITNGISEALVDYSQVIVMEDDICASPCFLEYMLTSLSLYRNDPIVASIHGYTPPVEASLPETFFLRGADCWGWATWRDRWTNYFNSDADYLLSLIKSRGLIDEFNLYGGYDFYEMLRQKAIGKCQSWAICWHASCFAHGYLTLHPGKTLIQNIGLDGSGEHSQPSNAYQAESISTQITVTRLPLSENIYAASIYSSHFRAFNVSPSIFRRIMIRVGAVMRKLKQVKTKLFSACVSRPD